MTILTAGTYDTRFCLSVICNVRIVAKQYTLPKTVQTSNSVARPLPCTTKSEVSFLIKPHPCLCRWKNLTLYILTKLPFFSLLHIRVLYF